MLSVAEPVQLCAEPCCLAVMCSQSVGGETRRGGKKRGGDRKAGWTEQKRFGSPCVADFVWKKKDAAEKSPSCPHSETGFIYSVPSSCVLLVVSRR